MICAFYILSRLPQTSVMNAPDDFNWKSITSL